MRRTVLVAMALAGLLALVGAAPGAAAEPANVTVDRDNAKGVLRVLADGQVAA